METSLTALSHHRQQCETYVLENTNVNRPTFIIKRYDEKRRPNASVGQEDFVEGSATAQLATEASKQLAAGDTFTHEFNSVFGSETFIIHSPDSVLAQGDYFKQPVKFIKQV